jgi:hypothetical protein
VAATIKKLARIRAIASILEWNRRCEVSPGETGWQKSERKKEEGKRNGTNE